MTQKHLVASFSLAIATLVLFSSLHAVQIIGAAAAGGDETKKVSHENSSAKVLGELHHHSDKSGSQFIKDAGDHQLYIDNRSLRLVRNNNKKDTLRNRLVVRWQQVVRGLHKSNRA